MLDLWNSTATGGKLYVWYLQDIKYHVGYCQGVIQVLVWTCYYKTKVGEKYTYIYTWREREREKEEQSPMAFYSWKDFHGEILLKYNTITLFRESLSGTLQGFMLRSVFRNKVAKDGTRYTLIPVSWEILKLISFIWCTASCSIFSTRISKKHSLVKHIYMESTGRFVNSTHNNIEVFFFLEFLLHPFTPLYIGGRVFSYRGYLVSCERK